MRRNSSSSSVSNTPSPNYQNRRRSSKSASPGNRKKKNVISPRRIVENSQIFHQEHILNQKLSRELRHARRELKREAYFANLRISKLTEQAKNATKNLDQGEYRLFY
jgi:small-conductance mechanosensitive channel